MNPAELLAHRFAHHPPTTQVATEEHVFVREGCLWLATKLDDHLPDGREKALAMTNLEQVMFWANAAIARRTDR